MSLLITPRNGRWLLAASLALSAGCANQGGGGGSSTSSESSYGGGGIQTSAIYAAPAAKQAANESRPLSELNTPEAVAAREAAARNEPRKAPAAAIAKKNAPVSATAATEQVLATPDADQQLPTLQKGSKVQVRANAALHARPSLGGDSVPAIATEFELGPQIYNAGGYWWYVTAGKESGWLLQTDIQR